MTEHENLPGNLPAPSLPETENRKGSPGRRVAAVCGWCSSAGAVGYLFHCPVAIVAVLTIAVLAMCAVAVLLPVLLGNSDRRSPFVRFMLLVCVLIGRPPGDYLPPEPPES